MFGKKSRLIKKNDFDRVLQNRKRFGVKTIYMKTVRNDVGVSRIGIMISKKISKSAVIRNRIRRVMREEIRKNLGEMKKGYDMVFVGLPGLEKLTSLEIREATNKLLKESTLL